MNNKEYMRVWYQKNKARQQKKSLEYHYNNRDEVLNRMAKYNKKHKAKHREMAKLYYKKNKTYMDKACKTWRQKNLEHDRERSKKYYYKNRKKMIKNASNYAKRNRLKINKRIKDKINRDPIYRLKLALQSRVSASIAKYSSSKFEKFLGCSLAKARKHLESQFKSGMSWSNHGKWHIDHIRPVSSFDLSIDKNIYECFNYKNLQPLWAKENLSKGAKYTK